MNTVRTIAAVVLLGSLSALPACGSNQTGDRVARETQKSVVAEAVAEAVTEARQELENGNISISGNSRNLPKAEITPRGELLVGGRAVATTPQQRALLLEYRGHVTGVAKSGMEIGMQGADLATKAMGEAFKGVFTGKSGAEIERSVEAEAARIKASAAELCSRLPAMMASQAKVAAALPEFRPYASMTQADIDDCLDGTESETATVEKPSRSN